MMTWWHDVISCYDDDDITRHDVMMTCCMIWSHYMMIWHDMMTCHVMTMMTWWHVISWQWRHDDMTWWHHDIMSWQLDDMTSCHGNMTSWHVNMTSCLVILSWWHVVLTSRHVIRPSCLHVMSCHHDNMTSWHADMTSWNFAWVQEWSSCSHCFCVALSLSPSSQFLFLETFSRQLSCRVTWCAQLWSRLFLMRVDWWE